MKYKNLKLGQAFQFMPGPMCGVYVRCRGGYRIGRGGPLQKFNFPDMPVYLLEGAAK